MVWRRQHAPDEAQRSGGGVTVVVSMSHHRDVVQRLPSLSCPVTSPCRMAYRGSAASARIAPALLPLHSALQARIDRAVTSDEHRTRSRTARVGGPSGQKAGFSSINQVSGSGAIAVPGLPFRPILRLWSFSIQAFSVLMMSSSVSNPAET
jgi:hypothetical protein